ncbi:MAG: LacI family transcriptional regulator [Flavobacteriaceae bacterium]|nr:LacI family transcriptional regulator [Flavobacteriaceae bacterium]
MKSRITIKDIARELSVSTSTVSKALKDSHEISESTKAKIKAFADFYHYKPNSLALKLRNQKTQVIGIIIPEIVHHFFSRVISGIEKVANQHGYNVMICVSNESYDKELLNIEMLANGSVDGLLISLSKETQKIKDFKHFDELIENNLPFVLFDRIEKTINCDKIIIDDEGGAYRATKYLIEKGCKKIALITTPAYVTVGESRKMGYIKAHQKHGINVAESLVIKIDKDDDDHDAIYALIKKLIFVKNPPDGIFAVNELYAALAMKVSKERGLRIPQDIEIIGFTDGIISEFSSPALTTVAQHGYTMGKHAAEMLINRIENKANGNFQTEVISTDLKFRESTLN